RQVHVEANRRLDCDGSPQARNHLGKERPWGAIGSSHIAPVASTIPAFGTQSSWCGAISRNGYYAILTCMLQVGETPTLQFSSLHYWPVQLRRIDWRFGLHV